MQIYSKQAFTYENIIKIQFKYKQWYKYFKSIYYYIAVLSSLRSRVIYNLEGEKGFTVIV